MSDRLLPRAAVPAYLMKIWGIRRARRTLASDSCYGRGIEFIRIHGFAYYKIEAIDRWARSEIEGATKCGPQPPRDPNLPKRKRGRPPRRVAGKVINKKHRPYSNIEAATRQTTK